MRAKLAAILGKLGVRNPNRTASQIALIINGAYVTGLMLELADLRGDLVDAAMKLLAYGLPMLRMCSELIPSCRPRFAISATV
jgi:hypothetical protein